MLWGQETKSKILSLIVGTSQGVSFAYKEAKSNTTNKTFLLTPGYAYSHNRGISIRSKNGKAFSDLVLKYKSVQNGIKGIVDLSSATGYSSRTSYERLNYIAIDYRYSRYVKTLKKLNTFFSVGIEASYILNEKKKLKYENGSRTIKKKRRLFFQ